MKSRISLALIVLTFVVLVSPRIARGQAVYLPNSGSDNPNGATVSPYLNLLQNNNVGSVNLAPQTAYQTLVRPFVNQGNAIQRQGASIQQLQQQVNRGPGSNGARPGATGHGSFFMNTGHFFPGAGAGAGMAKR